MIFYSHQPILLHDQHNISGIILSPGMQQSAEIRSTASLSETASSSTPPSERHTTAASSGSYRTAATVTVQPTSGSRDTDVITTQSPVCVG